jgi:DNA invertase Pin-like site-specific DNA recombinase
MSKYNRPPASLPTGSIVWAYFRDSGGEAQELSVIQQKAETKDYYCLAHGLTLSIIFADEARSAGSDVGRAEFLRMIDLTEDPALRPAGILFWNFARFARNYDDAQYYKALLRKRGLVLHNITGPATDDTLEGRLLEGVIDYANAEKLRQTSRDVKRALEWLLRQGYSAGGFPPKCYRAEKVTIGHKRNGEPRIVSKWVKDDELWEVGQLAWKLKAEGRSYADITQGTGGCLYKSRNCWTAFFSNKTYLGIGKCGDLEIPNHHPALIDQATWDIVQSHIDTRKHGAKPDGKPHPQRRGPPSLLSGYAVCIECGAGMVFERAGENQWPCYLCGRKRRESYKACPSRRVGQETADAAILNTVLGSILTEDYLQALLELTRAQFADATTFERDEAALKKSLVECRRKLQYLQAQIETFGPSRTAATGLQAREGEEEQITVALNRLDARRAAATLEISPEALALALDVWRGAITGAQVTRDIIGLRNHLQQFVTKIELGYSTARIHYTYPLGEIARQGQPHAWGHQQ